MARPVRIANFSGFLGDRASALAEMLDGGPVDVLTGDYLAELTMLILWKNRLKDPATGYAKPFLTALEGTLGRIADRGVKVVTNAGGLNPAGLADAVRALADRLGVAVSVAHVEGDDLMGRYGGDGRLLTANAYLGGWGIARALGEGADIVVCPRVTDASLVVGPAAWWHGWQRTDWDALAGAVVAGHVIECGCQATGGNYAFLDELAGVDMTRPGFPLAEVHEDGSSVITKHDGHGGRVSVGTVTAQLLYEVGGPSYANPDVVARFDTIRLDAEGPDRVRVSGVRGEPSPPQTKVCLNALGGFRNSMTFVIAGLDPEAKAEMVLRALRERLPDLELETTLALSGAADPATNEQAFSYLKVSVRDADAAKVGRRFSGACIELALASYAGFITTSPPQAESAYGVYTAGFVDAAEVEETVVLADGTRLPIPQTRGGDATPVTVDAGRGPSSYDGDTVRVPLGTIAGARSGDKGGDANVGVWVREEGAWPWLRDVLTVDRFRELVPESRDLEVERFELPNLLALNFVVHGFLGEGVASNSKMDPQAKTLGEYLRARLVDAPAALVRR